MTEANLAPKSYIDDVDGIAGGGGISLKESSSSSSYSSSSSAQQHPHSLSAMTSRPISPHPPTLPRSRTSSRDVLGGAGATGMMSMDAIGGNATANRSRANSNGGGIVIGGGGISPKGSSSSSSSQPAGSADTRRKINRLSKAREREKNSNMRLVEYFCVVSSLPRGGSSSSSSTSMSDCGDAGNIRNPSSSSKSTPRKNVTDVTPMSRTPYSRKVGGGHKVGKKNGEGAVASSSDESSSSSSPPNTSMSSSPHQLDGTEFHPVITSRYPLVDHEENPLNHDGIVAFCYPSGRVPIMIASSTNENDDERNNNDNNNNNMPKVHYFVTTSESGQKMYGTCLTIWEGHVISLASDGGGGGVGNATDDGDATTASTSTTRTAVYLPKCLVLLSQHPYLVAFREYLTQLHRLSKMVPPDTDEDDGNDNDGNTMVDDGENDGRKTSSSSRVGGGGGEGTVGTVATKTTSKSSSKIMRQVLTLPIERYITNFCSELPAPPPGSFQVQTTILDSVISIWSPPHNMPIAWVSLPFSHLYQCLDVDNVLKVWTALVLERQVLVTSTQRSLLATCCEIFLSMLFPLKWSHAYIPILPHFLVPILSAPMPFLCGIDKRHLSEAMGDLADECIVVDLDKNIVSPGVGMKPLPSLPKYIHQRLRSKVETNAGHVHREVRSLRREDDASEMGIHLPPELKDTADAMWESRLSLFDEAFMLTFTPEERRKNWLNGDDGSGGLGVTDPVLMTFSERQNLRAQSSWDAVQEAFLDTYCFLLQKYRKFLVFPSKHNEGAYGGAGFRSQEFLSAQRMDVRDFLEELVGTQMFDDFVTKRLYGSGEADISFFDGAVDRYVRNNGLVANVSGFVRQTSGGAGSGGATMSARDTPPINGLRKMFGGGRGAGIGASSTSSNPRDRDPPLLQSARVKRELKTIVPPEPGGLDLPDGIAEGKGVSNGVVVLVVAKKEDADDTDNDDASVASASTAASAAKHTGRVYYHYPTFPAKLDSELFGTPRGMSSAVRAEYDRQRENVGKFRRSVSSGGVDDSGDGVKETVGASSARSAVVTGGGGGGEKPATSEVTTFTVFFMTFTAVVGKELMAVDNDSLDRLDSKSIVSTYKKERAQREEDGDDCHDIAHLVDEIVMDADLPQTPTRKERRLVQSHGKGMANTAQPKSPARNRFNDKLSTLKIMEAKETAKAELVIAFEMLNMMKERGLRADPEAYQCLIDACGRCGDTDRATQLLVRMHEDGIVADGVVYSSLVSAFSAENAWKQALGEVREELPDWANGASIDMDWNTLKVQKRSYIDIVKEKLGAADENGDIPIGLRNTFKRIVNRNRPNPNKDASSNTGRGRSSGYTEQFVTDQVLRQIVLGENLLEVVYPDISIDTDNEFCPRCNYCLSDDDVVAGWEAGNSQEYKTECPNCLTKFVPHFRVQSTSPTFVGSRGTSSALFCERLSPWVLKKELRSVLSGGIEDLLGAEWREETKNAVLWWNLILSFMRYRFPFTFLLQGSFSSSLIAPTPDDESNEPGP